MTKRRVERLLEQAKENGHGDDGLREVTIEIAGVSARGPDDDPLTEEDVDAFELFTVDLETGETERPDLPDPADCPECSTPECENPSMPYEFMSVCEECAGMPRQDWRPVVRETDEEDV